MKKPVFVRPLKIDMNDHYSTAELYSVFQEQVFRKAGEIDVPLLRETTMAIDDRPDDEVAPNRSIVWQRIEIRRRELQKSFVGKYSRKTIALAVILMVLLGCISAGKTGTYSRGSFAEAKRRHCGSFGRIGIRHVYTPGLFRKERNGKG